MTEAALAALAKARAVALVKRRERAAQRRITVAAGGAAAATAADDPLTDVTVSDAVSDASGNDTPRKKRSIPKVIKTQTWLQYFGKCFEHVCWCCEHTVIQVTDFHAAHVIPESRGGTVTVANLRPTCSACNHSCYDMNLNLFKNTYFNKTDTTSTTSITYDMKEFEAFLQYREMKSSN